MCEIDGGLWPIAVAVLIICITVYNLKTRKGDDDGRPR